MTDIEEPETVEQPVEESAHSILIIDDNADIRTLVGGLLRDRYVILQASNGKTGIRLASKYTPDLIICDVMMHDLDGLEVCRRLKSDISTSHIPILMLTACSLDEQRIESYECGADAFLSKPFDSRMLVARCESLLLNRKRLREAFASETLLSPRTEPRASGAAEAHRSEIDNDFYRRFAALIERRMADSELSIEEMAADLGLSRVQFYRKIKALTNYSPAELLRILRLKRADMLLRTTENTVSEISYSVGFSSPGYFTKCYHDWFGEAPTEVQKRTSKITNR